MFRTRVSLPLVATLATSGLAGLAVGCYEPQLGDNPWKCSTDETIPECPQDFSCVGGICVQDEGGSGPADAGADGPMSRIPDPINCPDKDIEPNDDKAKATPVGFGKSVNWAVCTGTDKDYFQIRLKKNVQLKILVKYDPQNGNQGHLDAVFFGGTTSESAGATKSFFEKDENGKVIGRLLVAKAETMMPDDTFYLKVFALGGDMMNPGGANFYDIEIVPAK